MTMQKRFDVTIAGEINLDLILYGLPESLTLERELLATDFRLTLGSSSAIVAHNLAALGLSVGFIARLGDDPLGAIALERLAERSVDLSCVRRTADGVSTGVTILLDHGGQRHILTYPGAMAGMSIKDLDFDYLASARHFHIASLYLQKSLQPALPELCRRLKSAGLTLSLDTNDDPDDLWAGPLEELFSMVDLFLPNESEACRITGKSDAELALAALAARIPAVAIKCGSRGSLVQSGNRRWRVPAETVTPVDTVGAGDSFDAGFLTAYLRGDDFGSCAAFGNRVAALSTQRPGGTEAFRNPDLLRRFFASPDVSIAALCASAIG